MQIDRIREILREVNEYKDIYFDSSQYKIDSFVQVHSMISYVYTSALGTAKLLGQETQYLENIVNKINDFKGSQILTISIRPIDGLGDYLVILTDCTMNHLIGVYKKR